MNAEGQEVQSKFRNRKICYAERFGVTNEAASYCRVAALMRALDRVPSFLRDIGSSLERLASESSSQDPR
jgi:hypothetical protein